MSIVAVRPTRWIVPAIAVLAVVLAAAALAVAMSRTVTIRSSSDTPSPAAQPPVATSMTADELLLIRWHDALSQPRAALHRHFGFVPR